MNWPGEQLLIKLWETLADKGVGGLLKPWQLRREGRAVADVRRDEMLMLAQAERDAAAIRSGSAQLVESNSRLIAYAPGEQTQHASTVPAAAVIAQRNNVADALRREVNVSRALMQAEVALENEEQEPPRDDVDNDWLYKWRDSASQVSSEDLQSLWGRLLAGEVKAPGTYSLRTLEFLRNISHAEANDIAKLSCFIVENIICRSTKKALEEGGITFDFMLKMQELGVLSGVEALGFEVTWRSVDQSRFVRVLKSNGMALVATSEDPTKKISLPIYQVTTLGRQVLSLGSFEPNIPYLEEIGKLLKAQGVEVSIGKHSHIGNGRIQIVDARTL